MGDLTTLTALPAVIHQGTSLLFAISDATYTAPDWSLSYSFRQKSGAFTLTAAASGAAHLVSVTPDITAAYPPGIYSGEARMTHTGGAVVLFWSGQLEVKADLSQAPDGYDTRSYARKILDSLLELAATRASQDIQSYTVAGQSFTHSGDADLRQRIAYWQAIVDQEEGKSNRVLTRFQ